MTADTRPMPTSARANRGAPAPGMPRVVLITGAAGGIGSALARSYAAPGRTLLLHARSEQALQALVDECAARGANVVQACFDLDDADRLRQWLIQSDEAYALDLVIANAGININMRAGSAGEPWDRVEALIRVNITAAIATAHAVLPAMRARGRGQIAMISSLAAWRGLPETPSYSASKAAIKAWGEAMRDAVAADGVRINVVMPGYVHSKMAYDMPGPKPFMWSAERAARFIRIGLDCNRPRISFPFPLNLGCFLLAGLHPAVSGWILRRLNYGH